MCSATTIASSTSIPRTITIPNSEMLVTVMLYTGIKKKVTSRENGIPIPVQNAILGSRKSMRQIMTKTKPSKALLITTFSIALT